MNTVIYGLLDPDTRQLRYLGKTRNIKNRYKSHLSSGRRNNQLPVNRWIAKLQRQNKKPLIQVIDSCLHWSWQEAERWWIAYCRSISVPLLNITDGGESGFSGGKLSEEAKTKMSESRKGKQKPQEFAQQIRDSWLNEEVRKERLVKMHRAKKPNKETGFYGIYFCKANRQWYPRIVKDKKTYVGKCSPNPRIAAERYNVLAKEHYGENALLNFE